MLHISTILKHYKRKDVQEAMVKAAEDREVAVKYGDKGFGKRPDILLYPNDILEFAKKGATSFHVSEERWTNVMQISTDLHKHELDAFRKGWDMVIDIDCPLWEYAKYITHLIVQEVISHGITNATVKFSGNKGFHIGIPFESFPKDVQGESTAGLFPDGVRRIAIYIANKIEQQLLEYIKEHDSLENVAKQLGISVADMHKRICTSCNKEVKIQEGSVDFFCLFCDSKEIGSANEKYRLCKKCNKIMERVESKQGEECQYCKTKTIQEKLDLSPLLLIDTVLISSRHLYRMPYSLHEKSGLCSVPIDPEKILEFKKQDGHPDNVIVNIGFLDRYKENEAMQLLLQAFDYKPLLNDDETMHYIEKRFQNANETLLQEAIPADFFPPCMKIGLSGLKDGKKRFMFVLVNFLSSCGYDYDTIATMLEEWNKKNPEQLREVLLKGHVRYAKQHAKKVLPPNCDNRGYYIDMGICKPDGFCSRIKNPAQYAKRKAFLANLRKDDEEKGVKGMRVHLTEEQKETRKRFREKSKQAAVS